MPTPARPSHPQSGRHGHQPVAEISVPLTLPLGVARVLAGDVAEEGLVPAHQGMGTWARPDRTLLERVLDGLRRL
jgi:Protein of unknown function (DUF742)